MKVGTAKIRIYRELQRTSSVADVRDDIDNSLKHGVVVVHFVLSLPNGQEIAVSIFLVNAYSSDEQQSSDDKSERPKREVENMQKRVTNDWVAGFVTFITTYLWQVLGLESNIGRVALVAS